MVSQTVSCLACKNLFGMSSHLFVCKVCLLGGDKYERNGYKVSDDWETSRNELFHPFPNITKVVKKCRLPTARLDSSQDEQFPKKIALHIPQLKYFTVTADDLNFDVHNVNFFCQECSLSFKNEVDLNEHQTFDHSNFTPTKFVDCHFTFKVEDRDDDKPTSDLQFDVIVSKKEKQLSNQSPPETVEDEVCIDESCLQVFDTLESDSTNCFQCYECNKAFNNGEELDDHFLFFDNPEDEPTPTKVECIRCNQHFESFADLEFHLHAIHSDYRNLECPDCFCMVKSLPDLTCHQKVNGCDFDFNSFFGKSVHEKDKCHLCGLEVVNRRGLELHVKSVHHKIKEFVCNICSTPFTRLYQLKQHTEAVHDKIKRFQCDQCPYKSLAKSTLTVHVKIVHDKERRYICPHCSKAYSGKWHRDLHVKSVHDKICDYMCNVCGKAFSAKRLLKTHIKGVHENVKQYKCTHCKKVCEDKDSLYQHLKDDHKGVANYKCPKCPMTTIFQASLRMHMLRKHASREAENELICIE